MNRAILQNELAPFETAWKQVSDLTESEIAEWHDLAARSLERNVFLEPDFACAAAKLSGQNPSVLMVRRHGRLIGLFAGQIEGLSNGRAVATFVNWTHAYAPFGAALIDREEGEEAVRAFLEAVRSMPEAPKLVLFPMLDEAGAFANALRKTSLPIRRFGAHERAAFSPGANDALPVTHKKLKELRRQLRRLGEEGEVSHDTVVEPSKIAAAITEYLLLEAKGWKGRGGTAALSDAGTEKFMHEAVSALAEKSGAQIDFLRLNGNPVAASITLVSADRAWFWKISYDETFARYSPGVQLSLMVTENFRRADKFKLVDSCAVAGHPMIDHLWPERIAIADWLVPLGGPASLAAGSLFETARRMSIAGLKAARGFVR